ncbi:MAG: rhomboid family intramembrane serine protease [Myxococcota bacterium]
MRQCSEQIRGGAKKPQPNRGGDCLRFSVPKWSLFGLPPVISTLIATIVGVQIAFFLLIFINPLWGTTLYATLVLDPRAVLQQGQVWRLLTYALVHDLSGPMHLLFNAISLAVLGPALEDMWGTKGLLRFTFATVLGGGVSVCLAYMLGLTHASVVGASAAAMGMLTAFGIVFPKHQFLLWGLVAVTGRQLIGIAVAIELLYVLLPTNISTAAHVGGMITAAMIITKPWRNWRARLVSLLQRNQS